MGEHGEDEHGVFLYEPVIRVPLIVAGPGVRRGHVVTEQVRTIDLAPTVLDLLAMAGAAGADGESLRPVLEGGRRAVIPPAYAESYYPKLHYGWSELRALRADGWKVIDAPTPTDRLGELQDQLNDAQGELADLKDGKGASSWPRSTMCRQMCRRKT